MATNRTPWEVRLARLALAALPQTFLKTAPTWRGRDAVEDTMTLTRESDTGHEYEIEVEVRGTYEPAQDGGRTDPSWSASVTDGTAYAYRENKGWYELDLTRDEIETIEEHLLDLCGRDDSCDEDRDDSHDYY